MYPRVKYGLADGHDNEAADGARTRAMHASEADRLTAAVTKAADAAAPDIQAAAAVPADPS
jgi:hypothetical protein